MKILILGDLHLVSPEDPHFEWQASRAHFVGGRQSLPELKRTIRQVSPDYLISLGDLVDWYSDANRDFALDFLQSLNLPWSMTPGNHDASGPGLPSPGLSGWDRAGVDLGNRKLELESLTAYLINSYNSNVPLDTESWLLESLNPERSNAVFTHVPPDTQETRTAILERSPQRNLQKYVQSYAPTLYENALSGRVDRVWSGHLHFTASTIKGRTRFHIVPLAVHAYQKTYPEQGTLFLLDSETLETNLITYTL